MEWGGRVSAKGKYMEKVQVCFTNYNWDAFNQKLLLSVGATERAPWQPTHAAGQDTDLEFSHGVSKRTPEDRRLRNHRHRKYELYVQTSKRMRWERLGALTSHQYLAAPSFSWKHYFLTLYSKVWSHLWGHNLHSTLCFAWCFLVCWGSSVVFCFGGGGGWQGVVCSVCLGFVLVLFESFILILEANIRLLKNFSTAFLMGNSEGCWSCASEWHF